MPATGKAATAATATAPAPASRDRTASRLRVGLMSDVLVTAGLLAAAAFARLPYLLVASSYLLLDLEPYTARIVLTAFGVLTVGATYWLGREVGGQLVEQVGLVGLDGKPDRPPRPVERFGLYRFDPAQLGGTR